MASKAVGMTASKNEEHNNAHRVTVPQPRSVHSVLSDNSNQASCTVFVSEPAASRCEELALLGEEKCKRGETQAGIRLYEMAIAEGTQDLRLLSVLYCHLGNAFFALGDYSKALEYHRHDLILSRTIQDRPGEGKASGNLGNTLKALELYDESFICLNRHLEISKEIGQRMSEGNAIFNLGHLFQVMGGEASRRGASRSEVTELLLKATEYYRRNMEIVAELNDRAALGRVYGNIANTYYLLNQFSDAVNYHFKRLCLAKELGDKEAMKRAYNNLANNHVYLGEVNCAINYYKKALAISVELRDRASEGRSLYSLGNTSTLLRRHGDAAEYHLRHLEIARELKDGVGEARAAWSLGSAYSSLGQHNKAAYFSLLHLFRARQIGDTSGAAAAEKELVRLKTSLGEDFSPDFGADPAPVDVEDLIPEVDQFVQEAQANGSRPRRLSMENMELCRIQASDKEGVSSTAKSETEGEGKGVAPKATVETDSDSLLSLGSVRPHFNGIGPEEALNQDQFFEHVSRVQGRRIDEQRCDPNTIFENKENRPSQRHHDGFRPTSYIRPADQTPEDFLELIAGIQGRRMDDQRADLPFLPGLQDPARVLAPHLEKLKRNGSQEGAGKDGSLPAAPANPSIPDGASGGPSAAQSGAKGKEIDEDFLDMIMRCQSTRIEEQRSNLPSEVDIPAKSSAPTVPDADEDIFSLIMKLQGRRFDEQRAVLTPRPTSSSVDGSPTNNPSSPKSRVSKSQSLMAGGGGNSSLSSAASAPRGDNATPRTGFFHSSESKQSHKRTASQKLKKSS